MTVAQLLEQLEKMPKDAVVLIEGDAGYARLGGIGFQEGIAGMPDEVLLVPDMSE
jgi:hypothetical protein